MRFQKGQNIALQYINSRMSALKIKVENAWYEKGDKVKWLAPDGHIMTGVVTFSFMDGVLTVMPDQPNDNGKRSPIRINHNQVIK